MADSSNAATKPFSMTGAWKNTYRYEGIPLPTITTPEVMTAIRNMEIREDDVILNTYHKCGTHWMMEIILLIRNLGLPLSGQERLAARPTGLLELPIWQEKGVRACDKLAQVPSPRFYYTHLPIRILPKQIWEKKPKIVYVARNPRDSLVSWYNYLNSDPSQPQSWEDTFDAFLTDDMPYGPVWDHQNDFWKHRDDDNILYVHFENMKKDPAGIIAKVAAHIGYDLSTEQIAEVTRLSSLTEMKKTYARLEDELGQTGKFLTRAHGVLPFLHSGTVGGWRNIFTVAEHEIFQEYEDMKLKGFEKDFKLKPEC